MQVETVTLDRVFDVQRRESSRYWPRRTMFSFECDGVPHYAVCALGWPALEPGAKLTVVLEEAGNWQSLAGWKNRDTGELVLPDVRSPLWNAMLGAWLFALGVFASQAESRPGARWVVGTVTGFVLLMSVQHFADYRRRRTLAARIRAL